MNDPTQIRENRTGIATAPERAKEMIEDVDELTPPGQPTVAPIDVVRGTYILESPPAGTMPKPGSLKETVTGALASLAGKDIAVLLDALGARLQFERSGTRVYEALLSKVRALGGPAGGPTEAELLEIYNDELAHFQLLNDTIAELGGDPTAVTPSANVQAVSSLGLLQVITDPRMGVRESLQAILVVELADHDSWHLLIKVAESMGEPQLAQRFVPCLAAEEQHLARVRGWLSVLTEKLIHKSPDAAV